AAPLGAGEKEVPPPAPTSAARVDKPQRTDRPVESRPAPEAPRGLPAGSVAGAGATSLDVSDFPYAWYLRQVLQKVEQEWQRQNQPSEPQQKPQVYVEIQRDGSIRAPAIAKISGNSYYDSAALRAVMAASPFPTLPDDWSKPSLRILFTFDVRRG